MAERPANESGKDSQDLDPIKKEQRLLYADLRFFAHHDRSGSAGILTTSDLRIVTRIYPTLLKGFIGIYQQMTTPEITESAQQNYLDQYLSAALSQGRLVTDAEAEQLSEKVKSGEHTLQVTAHAKHLRNLESQRQEEQKKTQKRNSFDYYDEDDDDKEDESLSLEDFIREEQQGSISFKKGQLMSVKLTFDNLLEAIYGEVDYKNALLTEMLLQAPFLSSVTTASIESIDDEAKQRHLAYLNEVRDFVESFDPALKFGTFEQTTQQYVPDSLTEQPAPEISEFDHKYLNSLYQFAREIQTGEFSMENLYQLYQQTLFRRGTHFVVTIESGGLRMIPTKPEEASFEDVVGYDEQTAYFKTLLRRTSEQHPSMNNVRLVLLASKPGLGKTLSITAFLNGLPENARGIMFDHKKSSRRRDVTSVIAEFAKVAKLHPDLHIFAGIEDINTNEYLQDELLDVESIIPGNFPPNLHLIATTNHPESLTAALLRPGRTSEILIYEPTKRTDIRKGIVALHARKQKVDLSNRTMGNIASKTAGFTPDELAHIVRTISLECSDNPSGAEIDRVVSKIKERRNL